MRYGILLFAISVVLTAHVPVFAAEAPVAVSPGNPSKLAPIESRCPTFSWGAVDGTNGYQLVVYRLEGDRAAAGISGEPVLLHDLPRGVSSWTPSGRQCLQHGARYAWSIRTRKPETAERGEDWSAPRFFTVSVSPEREELLRAVEVLRAAGLLEGPPAESPGGDSPGEELRPSAPIEAADSAGRSPGGASSLTPPDETGLKADLTTNPVVGFAIHGVTATTSPGSAGVVGEATATTGSVHGVIGLTQSPEGAGGLFENVSGGPILSGLGPSGEVFTVDQSGAVTAATFTGSGAGLTNVQWGSLAGVPSDFGDGVDNDTVYEAGAGLALRASTLRVTSIPMEIYIEEQMVAAASTAEDPSIIIGRDGLPLIAYYEANTGDLVTVHCMDTICSQKSSSTIDSGGIVGKHNSITIGRDGNALISYYDDSGNQLKLAHCRNVECSSADLTVVDSTGDVGQYSSITTNATGYAFIAYYDAGGVLKAASCSNLTCSSKTIWPVDSGGVGEYTSVTRSYNGYGFISYYDASNGDLKLARCDNMNCASPALYVVDSDDNTGQHTAITTAADGHPLIAYAGTNAAGTVGHMRVAHCNSHVSCSSPTTDTMISGTGGTRFQGVSITRGVDGLGMITSTFASTSRVYTYHCKDIACSDSTIADDTVINGAVDAAITIGSDGLPIIAYTSNHDGDLFIAHCSDPSCQPFLREP